MRFVSRNEQNELSEQRSYWRRPGSRADDDGYFDGEPLPREIVPRHWLPEGDVHRGRRMSRSMDSTRYLRGPQVVLVRDDMRRTTWCATAEHGRLMLHEYQRPRVSGAPRTTEVFGQGPVWRYNIALNKYTGEVVPTCVVRANGAASLWHDGRRVDTAAERPDFPHFHYEQVPVGRIPEGEPSYGILTYKCRATGRVFARRTEGGEVGPEQVVCEAPTVGGMSVAVYKNDVLGRVDLLRKGRVVPATVVSTDGGRSFGAPQEMDLAGPLSEGFRVRPGYQRPIVDKGGAMHLPVALQSGSDALVVNVVPGADLVVEAIRVPGELRKGALEVFPSTLGSGTTFGNGVSDGHGLIMAMATEDGRLYSSNSSAGGSHFPEAQLLNHEMPLVGDFSASECYSSGLKANVVSMDYMFTEVNAVGRPISGEVFIETWDMPLPEPKARARVEGERIEVEVLNDADLEPGKVVFGFDDPTLGITGVEVRDLRHATIRTDRKDDVRGRTLTFDVLTLFHRHYGEAVIE